MNRAEPIVCSTIEPNVARTYMFSKKWMNSMCENADVSSVQVRPALTASALMRKFSTMNGVWPSQSHSANTTALMIRNTRVTGLMGGL